LKANTCCTYSYSDGEQFDPASPTIQDHGGTGKAAINGLQGGGSYTSQESDGEGECQIHHIGVVNAKGFYLFLCSIAPFCFFSELQILLVEFYIHV